ncbi:glycosyltransferase family 2 protein [Pseudoalteromonas haloplanktis]|uniref:Glycosyltransferase family 2 protein n=1 Tax=Pseudoalteromonas haloplanktis TaxID=228 RepID=A0ABU1BIQ5_PSEHA|nr:glycosyltransferase family 2 protein [Pseudoalteromonas haloplanktis]MDQ9094142.1 glycosyltransferase family 2 protein [Pseudoalteromonas haloplanktis]
MSTPLVSIIMPAYNSQKYISYSIESVLKQNYTNWELLITDDMSSDGTKEVVKSYALRDSRIKLFSTNKNSGAGVARNCSIENAQGRYIAFLDADDQWLPTKLYEQVNFMLSNNYAFTFTSYQKLEGELIKGTVLAPKSVTYRQLISSNVIGCLTAMYDTEAIGKCYMPLIRKRQDMGLWLEILKKVPKAYSLSAVLAIYRVGSGMSQNKLEILKWQWIFYRDVLRLNFFRACYYFSIYSIKGFIKYQK